MIIARKSQNGAFVTNELLIVIGFLVLAAVGAVLLARVLHLSWPLSIALVIAVLATVILVLSFDFIPRKRP